MRIGDAWAPAAMLLEALAEAALSSDDPVTLDAPVGRRKPDTTMAASRLAHWSLLCSCLLLSACAREQDPSFGATDAEPTMQHRDRGIEEISVSLPGKRRFGKGDAIRYSIRSHVATDRRFHCSLEQYVVGQWDEVGAGINGKARVKAVALSVLKGQEEVMLQADLPTLRSSGQWHGTSGNYRITCYSAADWDSPGVEGAAASSPAFVIE